MSTAILARTERKRLIASLLRLRGAVFLAAGIPLLLVPGAALSIKLFGIAAIAAAVAAPISTRLFDTGSGVRVAAATDLVVAFGLVLFRPHAAGIALMLSMWAVAYVVFLGTPAEARSIAVAATALQLSKVLIIWFAPDAWSALPGVIAGDHDAVLIIGGAISIVGVYHGFQLIDRHFIALNQAAESGEDRYRTLIDSAPLAFLVIVDGSISYVHHAGERQLAIARSSLIDHRF